MLNVLDQAGRDIGTRFDTETWENLIIILLGCVDLLLKDLADDPNQLATKICPLALKVAAVQI